MDSDKFYVRNSAASRLSRPAIARNDFNWTMREGIHIYNVYIALSKIYLYLLTIFNSLSKKNLLYISCLQVTSLVSFNSSSDAHSRSRNDRKISNIQDKKFLPDPPLNF